MKVLSVLCLFFVLLFLTAHAFKLWKIAKLRRQGIYPAPGKEHQDDVLRLLNLGEKSLAMRCYRSIHKVSLKEAKKQINLLKM